MKELVNHPEHYRAQGRKECIDEMIDEFGVDAVIVFCELNVFKYRYRHESKGGEVDLQKAQWYENKAKELKSMRVR